MTTPLRPLAVHALGIAIGYANAGTHEIGGDNRGDEVEFFQRVTGNPPGSSWCADFCFAVHLKAFCQTRGFLIGKSDAENRGIMVSRAVGFAHETGIVRTGYCPTVAGNAVSRGWFRDRHFQPVAGDWVLYDFHGQGEPHHVGLVRAVLADGSLQTVEGNTSGGDAGNQANGGGVYLKTRGRDHVFGFVHFLS